VLSGNGDSWAPSRAGDPVVVYDAPNSRWIMYYFGDNDGTNFHGIGRAFSTDLLHWTRDSNNPIVTGFIRPSLVNAGSRWFMVVDDIGTHLFVLTSQTLN
jgi:hypothetical protein